jgi:beta-N-acetylhexosaminidase
MAVEAGHDAVLKPADVKAVIKGLTEAVRSGRISESRIDRSVRKILYWKARLNLHRNRFIELSRIPSAVGTQEHLTLAREIADKSLTLLKNDGFFPSDTEKIGSVVNISIQKKYDDDAPAKAAAKLENAFSSVQSFYIRPHTADEVYDDAFKAAKSADTVVISLFYQRTTYKNNGPLPQRDLAFLKSIFKAKPSRTVVFSYGNPYHITRVDGAAAYVVGYGEGGFYGNQIIYADSFIKLLKGEISPQGHIPVRISKDYPLGSGIVF